MTKDSISSNSQTTAVQVALRIRPLNDRDRAQPRFANLSNDDVLKIHNSTVQVVPQNKLFTFDHVFGTTSTQEEIFGALGENLIRKFVEGYNITILAYGQTSSGKTYTMGTAADGGHNTNDEGIVPRSMALLFDILNNNNEPIRPISPTSSISSSTSASNKSNSRLRPISKIATNRSSHIPQVPNTNNPHKTKFTVKVSFIEIYNEDLHDLLNSAPVEELPPITIREDTKGRIYWTGVKEVLVHSTDDVLYYLEQGTQNRATGSTDMNEKSSRSHAIFSVSLKQEKWVASHSSSNNVDKKRPTSSLSSRSSKTPNSSRLFSNQTPAQQDDGEWLITTSKFHFVDLAGSERLKRTAAEGDRRKEGININAGLLALGNVISALGDPSKKNKIHVPYRDSKLTRLLQDSLGGSATTLMIACASPVEYNLAETLNTLQYANRARNIKNKSEKNQVEEWMTTENIELLRSLIGKLKQELNYIKSNGSPTHTAIIKDDDDNDSQHMDMDNDEVLHDQRMLISDLQRQLEELDGEASVTRERNRIVEKELQRIRTLESMMNNKTEDDDFQHLVEPVIEEYEKSVSKLESQLALTRAALNHSDIGFEEQQSKLTQLETLIRTQEQTISELRLRLGKVLEREQSNEGYIHELESKLMKSASETTKDQEMLNELKNRIMKFKETDENTEQYIQSLEQRLAAGDKERNQLRKNIEDLESKIEAKEKTNVELLKRLSKSTSDTSTEKLILKELDEVNAKYANLEKERDTLQQQIKSMEKDNHRNSTSNGSIHESSSITIDGTTLDDELKSTAIASPSKYINNRKSFANETETPTSIAALNLIQSEARVKEESERANRLQLTLNRLQYDHQETTKELDEVLQRYQEAIEQIDFLERDSSSTTANEEDLIPTPKSLDLSKEIAQAKEDAYQQEKESYITKIKDLEQALSRQRTESDKIQKLEHDLSVANKQIYILKQMESEHKATTEVEDILEKMNSPSQVEDNAKELLELEKQQTKYWKTAHGELKQDTEKLALDLDEKENYIVELKQKIEDGAAHQAELQTSLDESNQQSSSLQKRLAETLASLTVMKLSHDGLVKKNINGDDIASKHNQEKESMLQKHQIELANVQRTIDDMNQVLQNTTLDRDTALEKMNALELQLKEKTEKAQQDGYLEQEKIVKDHQDKIVLLTKEFETQIQDLNEKLAFVESELELSKSIHEETLVIQNQRLKETTTQHTSTVLELEEKIHQLQAELTGHQSKTSDDQSHYVEQMSSLELELSKLKDSHTSQLESIDNEHQVELSKLRSENERLNEEYDSLMEQLDSTQLELNKLKSDNQLALNSLTSDHQSALDRLTSDHQSVLDSMRSDHDNVTSTRERDINSHQTNVTQLQQKLDQLQARYDEDSLEYNKMIEALTNENELLIESQETNTPKLNRLIQLEAELQFMHAQHQTELETLRSGSKLQSDETTKQVDVIQQEYNLLKTRHAEQMEKLQLDHKKQLDDIQSELQALQSELNHAKEVQQPELQALNKQLSEKITMLESAKSDNLMELQKERDGLTEKVVRLESELITAKQDQVTLAQTHKEQLDKHSEEMSKMQEEHTTSVSKLNHRILTSSTDRTEMEDNLTRDLELLRTTHSEKEETIQNQRQMIDKHVIKIKELQDEITKLEFAYTMNNNDKKTVDSSEQEKLYKDRIELLEKELKKTVEENNEYTSLSEELEGEIQRLSKEKDALAEDLDIFEEMYQQKMSDMKSIVGVMSDDEVIPKIKSIIQEKRSTAPPLSIVDLVAETQGDQSSVNNNDTLKVVGNKGSGAISQQGPDSTEQQEKITELKQELKNYQNEMKDLVTSRDTMEKQLNESEKARKRLEKQLEELLNKKKSFMCF